MEWKNKDQPYAIGNDLIQRQKLVESKIKDIPVKQQLKKAKKIKLI